jgi:hypothetical protein
MTRAEDLIQKLKPVTPETKTEIPSLILRLVREEDAEELYSRVDQNREHLRQWMPWLDETKSASDTLSFIRRSLESATAGTQYSYGLLLGGEIVGVVSFKVLRSSIVARQWDLAGQVTYRQRAYDGGCQSVDRRGISTVGHKPHSSAGRY